MAATVAKRAVVHGLVQGVGFRYWTTRQASSVGVTGWVTNRTDGTVEALFEGPVEAVDEMIGWLRAGGAPSASVDSVDVRDAEPTGSGSFEIV